MTQMPTPPMDTAASTSQVSRARGLSVDRACSVQARPRAHPTTEVRYASTTSQLPIAKSSWFMGISGLLQAFRDLGAWCSASACSAAAMRVRFVDSGERASQVTTSTAAGTLRASRTCSGPC